MAFLTYSFVVENKKITDTQVKINEVKEMFSALVCDEIERITDQNKQLTHRVQLLFHKLNSVVDDGSKFGDVKFNKHRNMINLKWGGRWVMITKEDIRWNIRCTDEYANSNLM